LDILLFVGSDNQHNEVLYPSRCFGLCLHALLAGGLSVYPWEITYDQSWERLSLS